MVILKILNIISITKLNDSFIYYVNTFDSMVA